MKIRDDPEHFGKLLKRSVVGDGEEFLKYKEYKK